MSAIDNFANDDNSFVGDQPEDMQYEQAQEAPPKKKSSLPIIGAGLALAVAFSFIAYTKFMKPDAPVQAPVASASLPMEMNYPTQPDQAFAQPGMQLEMNAPAAIQPAIGFNAPSAAMPAPVQDIYGAQQPAATNMMQAEMPAPAFEPQAAYQAPISHEDYPAIPAKAVPQSAPQAPAVMDAQSSLRINEAHEKIAQLEGKIDSLQGSIDALLKKIESIERATPVKTSQAKAPTTKTTPSSKAPVAKKRTDKTEEAKKAAEKYTVYAMRADRVWVKTASGKSLSFGQGDVIEGIGRVETIDLDTRSVKLSSGAQLVAGTR